MYLLQMGLILILLITSQIALSLLEDIPYAFSLLFCIIMIFLCKFQLTFDLLFLYIDIS